MARARRRKMTFVDVYPEDDGAGRAFAEECSAVFTLYTAALKASPGKIAATASWTRIFMDRDAPATFHAASAIDDEPPDNFGFSESLRIAPNQDILAAPVESKPQLYLD